MRNNKLILFLFAFIASMTSNQAFAYDIAVENEDGKTIYYNYSNDGTELEVTYKSAEYNSYSGSVNIPETVTNNNRTLNVTSIGSSAFRGCSGLTSVTIPEGVTSIGGYVFYECSGLTSVTIPEGVTSIGGYVFYECSSLTSITIPESVTSIGYYAFSGCSGLTSVTIPSSVKSIPEDAFYGCKSLTSVTIPEGVTRIGQAAFYGCSGLTSVTIPEGVTTISPFTFSGCTGLTSVTIPEGVTSIGRSAFRGCSSLTSVTIPEGVTWIDSEAFYNCSGLTSVTIGSGVTRISSEAFSNCTSLNDVYCLPVRFPTTSEYAFNGSYPSYVTLHVPDVSVEQYKKQKPWSSFKVVVGLSMSTGTTPCAKPTLSYKKGQIKAECETDGAQCVTIITVDDAGTYTTDGINLSVTYQVSSYAIKPGYACSEVATATLCWIDVEPQSSGFTNDIAQVQAHAVLIQSEDGRVSVSGVDDGTAISVYSVDGMKVGAGTCQDNQAVIYTSLPSGSIAIVKIGEKSVKVVMR